MDNSNNGPTPGSPEYDEAMRAKYRQQAEPEAPITPTGNGERLGMRQVVPHEGHQLGLSVRTDSTLGPDFGRGRLDPYQAVEMRQEMEKLEAEGEEIAGYDPRTGEPIYRLQGVRLEAQQKRYAMLKQQLPLLEAAIARQQAEQGDQEQSAVDKLWAEKKRQDDIRARAEYLADEAEAQAMAEQIRKQRKVSG